MLWAIYLCVSVSVSMYIAVINLVILLDDTPILDYILIAKEQYTIPHKGRLNVECIESPLFNIYLLVIDDFCQI